LEAAARKDLTATEAAQFEACETTIKAGLQTFYEVGVALLAIRDARLYRRDFATFEDYCRQRWGMGASRARQLIGAAETVAALESVTMVTPKNERQVRPLMSLEPSQQREAWARAVETAPDGKISAGHVQLAVEHVAAVTKYPKLAKPLIPQKEAITIAKNLDALPEDERAEARSRLIADDTNTKAILSGRPPVPLPLPRRPKTAAENWTSAVVKIRQTLDGIQDNGGFVKITEQWEAEDKGALIDEIAGILDELAGMRAQLGNIITELEAETYAIN
jgi:hypothetical protein